MPELHDSRRTEATHEGNFVKTRWNVVLGRQDDEASCKALTWLCERYWLPLYAYLCSRGDTRADAKELLLGFLEYFLSRNVAVETDLERARFRSFLLGFLNHYLSDERTREYRQQSGNGLAWLRADDPGVEARIGAELSESRRPDAAFDRQWAISVMDHALERLRVECDADGRNGRFELLKPCLTDAVGEAPQTELAAKLQVSVAAVTLLIHRLRRRYREIVREEIAETVTSVEEVDAELRYLLAALRS